MKHFVLAGIIAACALQPRQDIAALLHEQAAAWTRGDLTAFCAVYADDATFISPSGLTKGRQAVLDRYRKKYDSRDKMGTLTFSDLEITPLGNDAALALGRWHLQRAKDEPHGRFSLILRRTKRGWKIVHDHSSAAS